MHGKLHVNTAQCLAVHLPTPQCAWQGACQHHRVRGRARVSAIEVSTVCPPAQRNARQCACQTPQNTVVQLPTPSCVRRRAHPCVAMHRLASQCAVEHLQAIYSAQQCAYQHHRVLGSALAQCHTARGSAHTCAMTCESVRMPEL